MNIVLKTAFLISFLAIGTCLTAQKEIEYKSEFGKKMPSLPDDLILTKDVVFKHEGMMMYCDSAVFNKTENRFSAYGIIDIFIDDTIHLTGDEVYYDGNTKIAEIMGKTVVLEDGKTTLISDYLVMERIPNTVRYTTGATIYDNKDTMTSITATYFMNDKIFNFFDRVNIKTADSDIFGDTINYNSKTNIAWCYGATTIVQRKDSSVIYTENGLYNTKTNYCESYKATRMKQKGRLTTADTLFYDSKLRNGDAFGNIYINDSTNRMIGTGDYANMTTIDTTTTTFLTGNALIKQVEDKDTLYFHADTLTTISDTLNHCQDIFAYNQAKIFRNDFQAAAEFAHYNINDSLLTMLLQPVMWNEDNQMTADTIQMYFVGKKIDRLALYPNAMVIQDADTLSDNRYNQMYGRRLTAYFEKGKIKEAEIEGNAQSIYYMWDDNKDKTRRLIGINIGNSSKMKIYFEKSKIKRLVGIDKPEYTLDDEARVANEKRFLQGFSWQDADRPKTPSDVFSPRNIKN
ncbi:MAG: hypothetical protein LBL74_00690 [Bacteroidales bacterium]|jgi:lipopolysaccharide export system protein LptA|nr:hypothetical protein [Bacteroidales bacterium]